MSASNGRAMPRDMEGRVPSHNLDALAADVHTTRERMDRIEEQFGAVNGKLDRLFNEVTRQQAQPRHEAGKILAVVVQCVFLLGASVSGVGFVLNSLSSAEFARHDERQKNMAWRIERLERGDTRQSLAAFSAKEAR